MTDHIQESKDALRRIADEIPNLRDKSYPGFLLRITEGRRECPSANELIRDTWIGICRIAESMEIEPPSPPNVVDSYGSWGLELDRLMRFCKESTADFKHSPDYASCNWKGIPFVFTNAQAAIVKCLHDAMKKGTPEVSDDYLCHAAGCKEESDTDDRRLRNYFKTGSKPHPAWGSLIAEAGKGKRKLNI